MLPVRSQSKRLGHAVHAENLLDELSEQAAHGRRFMVAARLTLKRDRRGTGSGRIPPLMAIEPGDQAPDFALPDQHGNPVKLSDLRGQTVVLYFYPKADTPGCTTQACSVRDHQLDYREAGAVVYGISPDPVKAIAKFDDKYGLGFPLLSDEDHAVCEAYGVWVEKNRCTAARTWATSARRS